MERTNLFATSGKHENSGNLPISNARNDNRLLIQPKEDTFQCTYFRQPPCKSMTTDKTMVFSERNQVSSNFSDTLTNSDSEVDEVGTVTRWLQTLPTNYRSCRVNDRVANSPRRVTFKRTFPVESNGVSRSSSKKLFMKREEDIVTSKRGKLTKKKSSLKKRNNLRSRSIELQMADQKYLEGIDENEVLRNYAKLIKLKEKSLSNSVRDGVPIMPTEPCQNSLNIGQNNETIPKKRKMMEDKIDKNKRFLASVKKVICTMNNNENSMVRSDLKYLPDDQIKSTIVKSNIIRTNEGKENNLATSTIIDMKKQDLNEIQKPQFQKPNIEKFLDDKMKEAVNKYKVRTNIWRELKNDTFKDDNSKKKLVSWLPTKISML